MVDEERVIRLLERVVADATFLADIAQRPPEDLLRDELALSAVKYRFVTAIEGCVKVGHHLAVAEGWTAPDTNAQALTELGRRGVISPELAPRLAAAAGFRNLLVHQYADIDDRRVVQALHDVADLQAFAQQVANWLRSQ